jgi:flavodoxin
MIFYLKITYLEVKMKGKAIAIRYLSKTGNTKKLAEQIGDITGNKAQTLDKPLVGNVDILFLGASVYWGGIDKEVKNFINALDAKNIGKVAVFSTSALAERAYPEISKLLKAKGITMADTDFYCRGKFKVLYRDKPDAEDLKDVREFAEKVCDEKQVVQ